MGIFSKIVDNILYPFGIFIGCAFSTAYVLLLLLFIYSLITGTELPSVSPSTFIGLIIVKGMLFLAMKMGREGLKKQFYAAIFAYVIVFMLIFGYLFGLSITGAGNVPTPLQDLIKLFLLPISVGITVKLFDYFFDFGASNKDFDIF